VGTAPDGTPITAVKHQPGAGSSALVTKPLSSRIQVVDQVPAKDGEDKPILDKRGKPIMKNVTSRVFACPNCGTVVTDRKGLPVSAKAISNNKNTCEGRYLRQIADPGLKQLGRDRRKLPARFKDKKTGDVVNIGGLQ
jgi:hypothetical protein